jgi:HEAT repeat protein
MTSSWCARKGRKGEPAAGRALAELVRDTVTPDIARATALAALGPYLDAATIDVIAQGLSEDDPGIRAADMRALESAPANIRVRLAFSALNDPVRAVRIEAARILASVPAGELPAEQQTLLDKGLQEYIEAQQAMASVPRRRSIWATSTRHGVRQGRPWRPTGQRWNSTLRIPRLT